MASAGGAAAAYEYLKRKKKEKRKWECVQVGHHKDVGRTVEEWQKNGWRLHTYTCAGPYGTVGGAVNHYLLFEKSE